MLCEINQTEKTNAIPFIAGIKKKNELRETGSRSVAARVAE